MGGWVESVWGFRNASWISQLSSLSKRSEVGPLSRCKKVEEEARVWAQCRQVRRSDRVAEKMGGLRKSGV